jgi:hypothetical protein
MMALGIRIAGGFDADQLPAVFRIDVAGLGAARQDVAEVAASLVQAGRALGAALDAEGSCWGDDEAGQAFGSAYAPAQRRLRDAFGALGADAAGLAELLVAVAEHVVAADGRAMSRLG